MRYYLYGKVDSNGNVIETFSRPNWFFDDGSIVTDDFLAKNENIYPINNTLDDTIDYNKFVEVENSIDKFILNKNMNIIENYYSYIERSFEDVLLKIQSDINIIKHSKIYSNIAYTFPDNITGVIQLRNNDDLSNIRALAFNAAILNHQGEFKFIDESNTVHIMNSNDILEMVRFIENKIQLIHSISQYKKSELALLTNIDTLLDYDIYTAWDI